MSPTIDLQPHTEARLRQAATDQGVDSTEYVRQLVEQALQAPLSDQQKAAIELLRSWREMDATDDPEELRAAEEEQRAFERAMNDNRAGEEPLYP